MLRITFGSLSICVHFLSKFGVVGIWIFIADVRKLKYLEGVKESKMILITTKLKVVLRTHEKAFNVAIPKTRR